jgi:methylase of polypeptide subunit release factors
LEWISESGAPAPTSVDSVGDELTAKEAARRLKTGEVLLWTGDYHNGLQLLKAIKRRLVRRTDGGAKTTAQQWAQERAQTSWRAEVLGRLVVRLEADGSVQLRRAPTTHQAVLWAWGEAQTPRLVALVTLMGALGAAGWRQAGLEVNGLAGKLTPHYGVFSPTRQVYVQLLDALGDVTGKRLLEVGCGTGVLSFVLLQRGLSHAVGTDIEPRAVVCATENAVSLGLSDRFQAVQSDLFVPGERFDLVLFNAPWMVGEPVTRLDMSIFDAGGTTLQRWLSGLPLSLTRGGEGALILSDLPERLGLRVDGALDQAIEAAGLRVTAKHPLAARHGRAKDRSDPLHLARSEEQITLYRLQPRAFQEETCQ